VLDFFNKLKTWFLGIEPEDRRTLIIGVVLSVAALVAAVTWSMQIPYAPLEGVGPNQPIAATQAVAALDAAEVPYQVHANGTVSVPRARVGAAWGAIDPASNYKGPGDVDLPFVASPRQLDFLLNRKLEGDLQRAIAAIEGVVRSEVHIVPAKASSRLLAGNEASASVLLHLAPGRMFSEGESAAVARLVANAVEGLKAGSVAIADQHGNKLADGDGKLSAGGNETLEEYRQDLEVALAAKVEDLLSPVLGFENFSVMASVVLDRTTSRITETRIDKKGQAVVSRSESENVSSNTSPGGVPGVDQSLPERSVDDSKDKEESEETRAEEQYIYPTVTELRERPSGGITSRNVVVAINPSVVPALAAVPGGPKDAEELRQQLQKMLQDAIVVGESDVANVTMMPFVKRPELVTPPVPIMAQIDPYLPYALTLIAMALGFVLLRPVMTRIANTTPRRREDESASQVVDENEPIAGRLHRMVTNYQRVDSDDLNELVRQEADASAEVIRMWSKG